MAKSIEIGKTYFNSNTGTYYEVLDAHNGGDSYLCREYETDELGNETDVTYAIVTAYDLRRCDE